MEIHLRSTSYIQDCFIKMWWPCSLMVSQYVQSLGKFLLVMYGCCLRINTFQWLPWSLPCWFALWCYIFVVSAVYTISLHRISSHTHITLMCHIPNLLLVTFLVFDCTETGEDGRVWDAQGVFSSEIRWGPVKSMAKCWTSTDLGQIIWGHQLLLGCFLFGHRTCSDTGATFQAGVKWWNWCGWDTGPRRKNQNSWKMVSNDMYRVMAIVTELPSDGVVFSMIC